jgi:hypothetical protein
MPGGWLSRPISSSDHRMSEWIILGWVTLVTVLTLNGTSAGVAALLHCRPGRFGRGGRILLAALAAGALPASFLVVVPLADATTRGQPAYLVLALALVFAVGAGLALPGAIVITRKLAKPGEHYRAFE